MTTKELLYTTVFCQCFSPCGKFVVACTSFGKIMVFSLAAALSSQANKDSYKPVYTFKAHNGGAIYSLVSTDRLLISAGTDAICAWNWQDIVAKGAKLIWALEIPNVDRTANPETNSLAIDCQDDTRLFAGCGDNMVHIWDISSGTHLTSLRGHTDYIHSVALRSSAQQCLSASEDGTVRLWDTRAGDREAVHIIEPQKNESCARPKIGKWIGCVAVDKADDWMVCGGGPALCLWHLRSLSPTTVFATPNTGVNFAMFHDDAIISSGGEPFVSHWSVNGDKRAYVPCSPTSVYHVAINDKSDSHRVLCIAGNCHKIDVCANFNYKAFSLTLA